MRFVDFKSLSDGGIIAQQSPINIIRSAEDLIPAKAAHKGVEYSAERPPTPRAVGHGFRLGCGTGSDL